MELIFVCGMKKGPHFLFFIQIHNLANIIYRKNFIEKTPYYSIVNLCHK